MPQRKFDSKKFFSIWSVICHKHENQISHWSFSLTEERSIDDLSLLANDAFQIIFSRNLFTDSLTEASLELHRHIDRDNTTDYGRTILHYTYECCKLLLMKQNYISTNNSNNSAF